MNLNWDAQYKTMLTTVTDKCRNLQRSDARPNQVQRIVESCIKGKIKYGLALMCYSMDQLETMNKKVDTALKKAFRLPIGAPTAFIRETTSRAGLGHHSLIADCSYTANKSLTTALNHDGKLGALTRALRTPIEAAYTPPKPQTRQHTKVRIQSQATHHLPSRRTLLHERLRKSAPATRPPIL